MQPQASPIINGQYTTNGTTFDAKTGQAVNPTPNTNTLATPSLSPAGNPSVPKPSVTPTYPNNGSKGASEVTTMSSASVQPVIADNAKSITDLSNQPRGVQTDPNSGQRYADGSPVAAPSDATPIIDENGQATGMYSSGGKNYYAPPADTSTMSPYQQQVTDLIKQSQAQADAQLSGTLSAIQGQYTSLIDKQNKINASEEAGVNTQLVMGDSFRNTSGNGIMAGVQTTDLSRIADLVSKENDAINSAKMAYQAGNDQRTAQLLSIAKDARDEQVKMAEKVQADLQAANKAANDRQQQLTDTLNKNLDSVSLEASKNGAPADVIAAIGKATSTSGAIQAAGSYLQTGTGQMADYLQYKKDALANGQTPQDYAAWKKADDARTLKSKEAEAYGTAFATATGKAAGEAKAQANQPNITTVVTSPDGINYNIPSTISSFVRFAGNGVKFLDLSGVAFSALPASEKAQIEKDATNAGIRWIDNKNNAADVQNMADATNKLSDMKDAFDSANAGDATQRNLYQAALNKVAVGLQSNPDMVATDVYQVAALDVLKAVSGLAGFRGGSSMVEMVAKVFPKVTDTKDVVDQKMQNLQKLLDDRQKVLVGEPTGSDKQLIDENNAKNTVTKYYSANHDFQSKIDAGIAAYKSAHGGQDPTYSTILKAFPEIQ